VGGFCREQLLAVTRWPQASRRIVRMSTISQRAALLREAAGVMRSMTTSSGKARVE